MPVSRGEAPRAPVQLPLFIPEANLPHLASLLVDPATAPPRVPGVDAPIDILSAAGWTARFARQGMSSGVLLEDSPDPTTDMAYALAEWAWVLGPEPPLCERTQWTNFDLRPTTRERSILGWGLEGLSGGVRPGDVLLAANDDRDFFHAARLAGMVGARFGRLGPWAQLQSRTPSAVVHGFARLVELLESALDGERPIVVVNRARQAMEMDAFEREVSVAALEPSSPVRGGDLLVVPVDVGGLRKAIWGNAQIAGSVQGFTLVRPHRRRSSRPDLYGETLTPSRDLYSRMAMAAHEIRIRGAGIVIGVVNGDLSLGGAPMRLSNAVYPPMSDRLPGAPLLPGQPEHEHQL